MASCLVVKSSDPSALVNDKGQPIIRPYTPISPPDLPGELTLLVKKYDNGNASKYIHSLKVSAVPHIAIDEMTQGPLHFTGRGLARNQRSYPQMALQECVIPVRFILTLLDGGCSQ